MKTLALWFAVLGCASDGTGIGLDAEPPPIRRVQPMPDAMGGAGGEAQDAGQADVRAPGDGPADAGVEGRAADVGMAADAAPAPDIAPPLDMEPLRPPGAACSAAGQCASGFCVGSPGRCCDRKCDGSCETCGTDGRCTPIVNRCARDTRIACVSHAACGGVCAGPSPIAGRFCPTLGGTPTECAYCDNNPSRSCTFTTGCTAGGKCLATNCVVSATSCCGL